MNDIFQCGDSAALVAYLYDECAPGEQVLIEAHLNGCAICASEIEGLRATRRTLAAWAPPEQALGFRITREHEARPAGIVGPKIAWWRAPLPAWAQAAAALVIFGVGLSVGSARPTVQDQAAAGPAASVLPASMPRVDNVSRDDLAQLEQRIRAELGQLRAGTTTMPVARESDEALIQRVRTMIDESAADERRNFTERMLNLADVIERQRRVDLAQIGNSMGQFRGATRDEIRQQNEMFSEALRRLVSDTPR
jgi:hypothetical protein